MAALREVLARFGVKFDSKELDKGNKSIDTGISKLKAFGAALVGSAVVGGMLALTKGVAQQVDQLAKQAIQLGVSTNALHELRHAAGLSGASVGDIDGALVNLNRNLGKAANGNKILAETFQKLDVPFKNADGSVRSADEALGELADAFKDIQSPAERTNLVMDVFGGSGAKLIPMLAAGSEGIAKMRAEVGELGATIDEDFAGAAQEMNDNLARMNLATFGLKVRLANLLIPIISRVAAFASRATAAFGRWAESVKGIMGQSNVLKAAIAWLGMGGLMHVLKLVGGFKGLWAMFTKGIAILARFALRIALPILLIDELITTFQGGDTLIRRALDNMFGEGSTAKVVDFVKNLWTSFTSLFTDLDGVLSDFGEFFRMIWTDLTGWLSRLWSDTVDLVVGTWQTLVNWAEAITLELVAPFAGAAASITYAFGAAWNTIVDGAQRAVTAITGVLDKLPGVKQIAGLLGAKDGLTGAAAGFFGGISRAEGGNAAETQRLQDTHRLDLAQRMDASRVAGPTVNGSTVVNVNVPPGTPANMARAVGNAAAQGANKGNRATLAAVRQVAPG